MKIVAKRLSFSAVVIAALILSAATANAIIIDGTLVTDAELNDKLEAIAVAESRIGDLLGGMEKEIKLVPDTGAPGPEGNELNFGWGNGVVYDFSLQYDADMSQLMYVVGDNGEIILDVASFNCFAIRAFINAGENQAPASVKLTELSLDIEGNTLLLADVIAETEVAGSDLDLLCITGLSGESFTLSGKQAFDWGAVNPMRSNQAYQIKLGNCVDASSVPAPLGVLLLASGLFGLLALRRRSA